MTSRIGRRSDRATHLPLDVLCAGEALWDLTTTHGASFDSARSLKLAPGGAAVNTAIHLARLGRHVGLAASMGDDALGRALALRVAREGVDVQAVATASARTGLVFADGGGATRRVVSYRDPAAKAAPIPEGIPMRILLLSGLRPSAEQARTFRKAAARARGAGATVIVDVNARPRLWSGHSETFSHAAAVMQAAHVVKASVDDLVVLGCGSGERAIERARTVMRKGAVLVLTQGGDPAKAIGKFGEIVVAPSPMRAIEPMGAGDAFTAGMIDALLEAGEPAGGDVLWAAALARGHGMARRKLFTSREG